MKHIIITLLALSSSFNISPYIPRKTHIFSSPATSSTASPLPKHDGSLTPDCEYSSILSTDRNKKPPLSSQEYPSVGQLKSVIPKSCFEVRECTFPLVGKDSALSSNETLLWLIRSTH